MEEMKVYDMDGVECWCGYSVEQVAELYAKEYELIVKKDENEEVYLTDSNEEDRWYPEQVIDLDKKELHLQGEHGSEIIMTFEEYLKRITEPGRFSMSDW